ncbi:MULTISPECIES: caspase family protein [unclassified Phyllobacterium]|uniref:caspase family protein n=1 Tax=unclassified Phyllobacterium TaxID=2638441 RepID=UPI00301310F5
MRILLAIGCDEYIHPRLSKLSGAFNDAKAIYDHLVVDGWGEYDSSHSRLVLSPSLTEVREIIEELLFNSGPIDEFTFFFAGHGGTKDDAYFLCLKDSQLDRLSITALSMSQLFGWLNEAKVRQTNIIIDACQSGGITRDVSTLLNPSVIGKTGSPAVSILAASGSNESAEEVDGRGRCTDEVMRCLKGDVVVQTSRPVLDLVEIGKMVSESLGGQFQTPVYWGINLYGRAQFAKNPLYSGGQPHITEVISNFTTNTAANNYIRDNADRLWEFYLTMSRGFDAPRFIDLVEPFCDNFANNPDLIASFLEGIANTFGPRLRGSCDLFDEAQLHASCLAAMLAYSQENSAITVLTNDLTARVINCVDEAIRSLLIELQGSEYALLSAKAGFADLYFLPLRLLSILGWIGASAHASELIGRPELLSKSNALLLLKEIVEKYSQSIVAISDEQTSSFIAFATSRELLNCTDEVEVVSGYLFSTLYENRGIVAASGLSGSEAFSFLEARIRGDFSEVGEIIARPTTLLPALLLVYNSLGMPDVIDGSLKQFDHVNMNLYIPDNIKTFAEERMDGGLNYSFAIGHDIWSVADFVEQWRPIEQRILLDPNLSSSSVRSGALFSSLLRPNREPWYLLT